MKNRALTFWLAVLFCFTGIMIFLSTSGWFGRNARSDQAAAQESASHPDESGSPQGSDLEFELTDQDGQAFHSETLHGKVWIGSVFFSSCASTCRSQNAQIAKLQRKYGDRGVQFVSITCDPETDTPDVLKPYAKLFGAEHDKWTFLTGDFDLIAKIGREKLGISVDHKVHSDRLVLFDGEGSTHGAYGSTDINQFNKLETEIEKLLDDRSSGATRGSEDEDEEEVDALVDQAVHE